MKRVLLALFALGIAQSGYCGWKDALKEVAKQVVEQSSQTQPQQQSVQQAPQSDGNSGSQQKTAEQMGKEEQEKQKILVLEQKYPRNWLTQFRMVQYGFKPEDKEAIDKVVALENLMSKIVQVDDYSAAKYGTGMKFRETFEIFGVNENDQARVDEFVLWFKKRFTPIFLKHCTTLYQITKEKELSSIDELSTQQKLEYVSKVHFTGSDKSPYLVDASPIKGKALQTNAADVEVAYQGYQGSGKDDAAVEKAAGLVQEKALAKKKQEERSRKIEALSRKSGKPDVVVSIGKNQFYETMTFDIQAVSDKATIWAVNVNRGNCVLPEGTAAEIEGTITLKFGQTYRGYSNNCRMQEVREIEVVTENGKFVFNF